MKLALFTSNHLRHHYIAHMLHNKLGLELIVSESKNPIIENDSNNTNPVLKTHFIERNESEELFFGHYNIFPEDVELCNVGHNKINSNDTIQLLEKKNIDFILLFGSSIIKDNILSIYPNKVFNLHLGLSPYYKGSGTNFFPMVNNEFECIGATFHLANNKVDSGEIFHQIRLQNIYQKDTIHSIGNRIIKEAGIVYPLVVNNIIKHQLKGQKQSYNENDLVYRLSDFLPEHIDIAKNNLQKAKKIFSKECDKLFKVKPIVSMNF